MRCKERIPIVLKHLDIGEFLDDLQIPKATIDMNVLKQYWEQHPDLRLTQALVNLNMIENVPGFWYYTEEDKWLIEHNKLDFGDIAFWGQNFDENNLKLPKTKWILLKDLDIDHIKNILKYFNDHGKKLLPSYVEYFNKRINEEESKTKGGN